MNTDRFVRAVTWVAAAFNIVFGVWAFVAPESFFDEMATFQPYNEHFLHDIGAFQIGFGAVLALAAIGWSGLRAALGGVGIGSALHAIAHIIDGDLGGKDTDPYALGMLAVAILIAAALAGSRPRTRADVTT